MITFGFIRVRAYSGIYKRQGQGKVKILYEIIQLDKFLTHSDLEEMQFEFDIDPWEYNRTHWAIKDIDLSKELSTKGVYLPQPSNKTSKIIGAPKHHLSASFSIPGEIIKDAEPVIAALENEIGRNQAAVKIAFCYAHEDEGLLNQLKRHLSPLQRQGLIDFWYDRDISPGVEWKQEISEHLNKAEVILLLVSPDFISSDYCYSIEMKKALERHDRKEAYVIPIILRPTYWQGLLGHIQALPVDAKPIVSRYWYTIDESLHNVVEGIRKIVDDHFKQA